MAYRTNRVASVLAISLTLGACGGSSPSDESGGGGSDVLLPPARIVVAGSIDIEANTRVDADTADGLILGRPPLTEPQLLPASFILAGYVSFKEDSRGTSSPFDDFPKDPEDHFRVPFEPGERLSLRTFSEDADGPLVTLTLRRLDGTELESQTTDPINKLLSASVSLPVTETPGDYIVVVSTGDFDPPPVRYVLSKTAGTQSLALNLDWPRHAFVPGRAIVAMAGHEGTRVSASSQVPGNAIRSLDYQHWLVAMPANRMSKQSVNGQDTLGWIDTLRQQPGVVSATPDYLVSAQGPLDEPLYPKQWHYDLINMPAAWQLEPGGGVGVKVAVLDTGLFRNASGWHPDVAANVLNPVPAGADFVSAEFDNDVPPGRDNDPRDPGNAAGNNVFHGTHVAGTVVASATNQLGGTGVAFGAELLPVRVLGEGGIGSSTDLIDAIRWVGASTPVKADIINLSLGGLPEIPALQSAIDDVVANGVIVVAAAGNQASSSPAYPAAAQGVFSVSAVDAGGSLASYSNFGPWIDLAAPGGDVRRDANLDGLADLVISSSASLGPDGFEPDYTGLQGTSMAAPHVAGVFALMKSLKPDLNAGTLASWLAADQLTTPVAGGRSDALGYGVIDSGKAVLAAIDNPSVTILSASPAAISLSSETRPFQTIELQVLGDQTNSLVINPAIASPAWLDVTLSSIPPFSITVALDEQALEPDVPVRTKLEVNYTTDSARVLEIPVVAELVTDESARNAGRHFVLLVYTEPNAQGQLEAAAQLSMTAINGTYQFGFRLDDGRQGASFADVPPGDYYLVAGTDLDNDGIICQSGEACAEYPVTGMREVITVDESTDLTGIRMATGYFRPTISAATPDVLPRPGFTGYKLKEPHSNDVVAPKTIGAER
ncbi:S8 family serine peptidase [Marinobacter sp. KMM 10035]|uniref:S8 family serine peptidase n=1 Tax=Marinobacter sp. KMM 10035 TaxID=3134034 RepID=UPI00397AFD8E